MQHFVKYGHKVYQPPYKVAFRGHLSPIDDIKVRPVWVAPFEVLINESVYCSNIYEILKGDNIMHFGANAMPRLHKLLNTPLKMGSV